jgi:predicted small secreted protein
MNSILKKLIAVCVVLASLALGGCGYNTIQEQDEAVKAS